jgi:hypothetical protein
VVEVEGTVLVVGVVVAGAVLEAVGSVAPTPGTVLDGAPAMVVVVELSPGTDVLGAPELGLAVVVVAPATVVGVVALATVVVVDVLVTVVDVELSGAGSAECADVEVAAITTSATSGARTPTDRTRVRTVGNTVAP